MKTGSGMRIPALGLIVLLSASSPVAAQPFSDGGVPSWVYAAMQSLKAHGLLSTALPDPRQHHLTRAELAQRLAQVLAGLTSKQASDPAATEAVRASDLAVIQHLLREFEADLASVGVRIEVARETLQRLAQRPRRIRVSGDSRFRYEVSRMALNNPGSGPLAAASTQPALPAVSTRWRLTLEGGVTDTLRMVTRLTSFTTVGTTVGLWGSIPPTGHLNSRFVGWDSAFMQSTVVDTLGLRWKDAFGLPLEIQLGHLGSDTWIPREGDPPVPMTLARTPPAAFQLGPLGLLLSTAKDAAGERSLRTFTLDALALAYRTPQIGAQAVVIGWSGETFYGGRIQSSLNQGLVVGLNAVVDSCYATGGPDNAALVAALTALGAGRGLARCSFVWWGAQNGWLPDFNTGSTNPITNLPGSGYSVDVDMFLSADVRLQGEAAWWNDPTAGTTALGWQVQAVVGSEAGGPVAVVGYQAFATGFYPSLGAAEDPVVGFIWPGGFQDVFVTTTLHVFDGWVLSAGYETGTSLGVGPQPGAVGFGGPAFSSAVCQRCSPAGQPFSGWLLSLKRDVGPATMLHLYYYSWQFSGIPQSETYRMELWYHF